MPLEIIDGGSNNVINLEAAEQLNGKVIFRGSNNRVILGHGSSAQNLIIDCMEDNIVHLGGGSILGQLFVYAVRKGICMVGDNCGFNGLVSLLMHERGQIRVGAGCLFGGEVVVTLSDMHSILDAETGQRINFAESVQLGDRVWVGQRALILKGVTIGADSVIGAHAVVTRSVPPSSIAAGNPARVVRQSIKWDPRLLAQT